MAVLSAILPSFTGHIVASRRFRLRLVRPVGRGAYGVVYLAHDLSDSSENPRAYAVKCMLKHERGSELEHIQEREITYHKHMSDHPQVTTLHEVIADQFYVYVVMDFYDGGDLFGAIIERQSFHRRDDVVKKALVQLLDAVEACHQEGIFHRDLKPENVMCSQGDSEFFLSDFGLATQTSSSTGFGCGSSYYMSPECLGESSRSMGYSTITSDVWSIGIILTNMLTGRNPWRMASLHDDGFAMYFRDGLPFLLGILAVSEEAGYLLTRILDPNPRTRITIPELRRATLHIGTFFPPDDLAIEEVPRDESLSDVSLEVEIKETTKGSDSLVPIVSVTSVGSDDMEDITDMEIMHSTFVNQASSGSSSDSDLESECPETPEVRPVEQIAIIPYLALAELEALALQIPPPAKVHHRISSPVKRFVGALHRMF
ncbi:hypothetical protein EIP86_000375 [Pleurotus ostreatoroseus]|nr:hypothetical protein EIP86_000375 [Pleurotus ostreatoroseus]